MWEQTNIRMGSANSLETLWNWKKIPNLYYIDWNALFSKVSGLPKFHHILIFQHAQNWNPPHAKWRCDKCIISRICGQVNEITGNELGQHPTDWCEFCGNHIQNFAPFLNLSIGCDELRIYYWISWSWNVSFTQEFNWTASRKSHSHLDQFLFIGCC